MTRGKETVRPDDGETRRVLVAVADASRHSLTATDAVEACMAGDEQRVVARVEAKPVNMAWPAID